MNPSTPGILEPTQPVADDAGAVAAESPPLREIQAGDDPAEVIRLLAGEIRTRLHEAQQREETLHQQEQELQSRYRALRVTLEQQRTAPGTLPRLTSELAELDARTRRLREQRRGLSADEQVIARMRSRLESIERSLLRILPELDEGAPPHAGVSREKDFADPAARRSRLHLRLERVRETLRQAAGSHPPQADLPAPQRGAHGEPAVDGAQLAARSAALESLERELATRRAELDESRAGLQREAEQLECDRARFVAERQSLAEQRGQIARDQQELAEQSDALERRQAELHERKRSLDEHSSALESQLEQLATRRTELDTMQAAEGRCQAAVAAALRERDTGLLADLQALEERARALRQREAALRNESDELDQREIGLLQRDDELREKARRLDEFAAELAARAAQIQLSQQQLRLLGDDVELQRSELADLQREAGQARDTLTRQQDTLQREQARLEDLRLETESIAAQLRDRRGELEQRERALAEQASALKLNSAEVAEARADIERRRAEIEGLYAQATSAQDEARRGFDESQGLREQLIAEHAELRGSTLRLAAEWQQIEQERERLEALRVELQRRADELATAEAKAADAAAPLPRSRALDEGPAVRRGSGWLRGLLISAAVGSACAMGWWQLESPAFRSTGTVQVDGDRDLAAHLAMLLSPEQSAAFAGNLAGSWTNALRAGWVSAEPAGGPRTFELTLSSPAENRADLLRGVLDRYVSYVAALPPLERDSAAVARWEAQSAELESQLAAARQARQELAQTLENLPADAYERAFGDLQQLRNELQEAELRLSARRAELDALLAEDAPRASITNEMLNAALVGDPVYQEDTKELAVELRKHRTELAVVMVLVSDPLREFRAAVQAAAHTLNEQRGLQPPVELLAALDRCDDVLTELDQALGSFAADWDAQRESVERSNGTTQPTDLLQTQRNLRTRAADLLKRSQALLDDYARCVEGLTTETTDNARAVVVVAVLRSDVGRLREQSAALEAGAKATELTNNPRLDTSDRQIRNLVGRLEQRGELARRRLEEAAIEQARVRQADVIRAARNALADAQQERPELLDLFQRGMERLEQARVGVRKRLEAEASIANCDERIAMLQSEQESHAAARPIPRPERAEASGVRTQQIAGADRQRDSVLAGACGAAVTALSCFLFAVGRGPRRLRVAPGGPVTAQDAPESSQRSAGVAAR